jgi:LPXTG-motif cell wall-anchored protein
VEKADNYDISYVTNADGSITVVNRPSKETVSVPVVKKWADGASGESAAIVLTQNGSETGYTLTLNEDNSWSGSFDNLPKYDNSGKEYTYSVVEKTNSYDVNYVTNEDGSITVVNSPKTTKTSLNVKKEWADGASGESAVVVLTRNGEETDQTVTLNEGNNWSASFDDLDEYAAEGTKYKYSVVEKTDNYQVSYEKNGNTVTVTNRPIREDKTQLVVNKEWADGASGESAAVVLTRNGEEVGDSVELNENNGWSYTFTDLDKYDENGNAYTYSVVEKTNSYDVNYVTNDDGSITVVNSPKASTTSLIVKKEWADGASGESATVVVKNGDEEVARTVLNESNNWTDTFEDLPKYDNDGTEITYAVDEITSNYDYTVDKNTDGSYTITNSPKTTKTSLNVKKEWADGASGESAVVVLTRNGEETDQTVTLNEGNNWSASFDDLDEYAADGTKYEYSVVEKTNNYQVSYEKNGNTVTVTNRPIREDKTQLVVNKEWADGASGESAAVVLTRNGEEVGDSVELNENNGWSYTFTDLDKYDENGNAYTYSVVEKADNYDISYVTNADGSITVVNRPSKETVSVPVVKKWADGASGESAAIVLTQNGSETGYTLTLNEDNSWSGSFDNLPKYDNSGKEYTYSVVEKTNSYRYTVEEDGNGGYIVTNYPKPTLPRTYDETPKNDTSNGSETGTSSVKARLPLTGVENSTALYIAVMLAALALVGTASYLKHRKAK